MRLPEFKAEQWMTKYEKNVTYNMTDTCVPSLNFKQLITLDSDQFLNDISLDYGTITGDTCFKQEILKMYKTGTVDNITSEMGCLHGDETIMQEILSPNDIVITFTPGYQQFSDYPKSLGCKVIEIPLLEENNWQLDIDKFKEAMKNDVKLIIINNPSNPTGSYFNLKDIIKEAKKKNTYILVDEVYRDYRYEESISDLYENGISTGSLSKMFGLAGLRLGWIKAKKEIIDSINLRKDYSFISTGPLSDTLGLIALKNKDLLLDKGKKVIEDNKKVIKEYCDSHKELSIILPKSGTVGLLKYEASIPSEKLCLELLKKYGVFYVPGKCFNAESHVRISFTHDIESLRKGLELTSKYLLEK